MTEVALKWIGFAVLALVLIGIGAAGAWQWQANSYTAIIKTNEANHQADLTAIANAGAAQARQALGKQKDAEQALATLDTKATQEKADALAENETLRSQLTGTQADNDRLRGDVAAGDRRLRIAGRCPASNTGGGNVSAPSSTTGLGDAATVEISAAAGQTVFDIRAGIIADQAALRTLQDYATNVCQGAPAAGNAQ
ncbi:MULTISPECIES: lysis system i-spanin subunit Rz [unclassified Pseudomonas]|uniref:lysis system i-spanin subunit Rz n=1 Tax=unclassified Pseudomonas TaxID=196821 RepID=UPI002E80FDC9|nr:lysis system i-spanin subunit Rz [Pseudomonas sp. 10C3]MEE3507753.1 lysis system i-spanin subunit Rz [Pseudomonas sp. 10C3]